MALLTVGAVDDKCFVVFRTSTVRDTGIHVLAESGFIEGRDDDEYRHHEALCLAHQISIYIPVGHVELQIVEI